MSRLKKVTFDCEVITPMFLAGADQNKPEIRAASIRGVMRFWLRALLGGRGFVNSQSLFREEERLLGSSEKGSSVALRVVVVDDYQSVSSKSFAKNRNTGLSYLWYSINMNMGDNEKYCLPPNMKFKLALASFNTDDLLAVSEAFYLLALLGGVGTRSRRCAGSFSIISCDSDIEEIVALFNGASSFEKKFDYFKQREASGLATPLFNILHSQFTTVYEVNDIFKIWDKAANEIGVQFRKFRSKKGAGTGGDYDQVKAFIQSSSAVASADRVAFGLPLTFRYRSLPNHSNNATIGVAGSNDINRKASPLIIQIKKVNGDYKVILTHFKSDFLPTYGRVEISKKGARKNITTINHSTINSFLSTISNKTRVF